MNSKVALLALGLNATAKSASASGGDHAGLALVALAVGAGTVGVYGLLKVVEILREARELKGDKRD